MCRCLLAMGRIHEFGARCFLCSVEDKKTGVFFLEFFYNMQYWQELVTDTKNQIALHINKAYVKLYLF